MATRKALQEIQYNVLDGSAVLWVIHWKLNEKVRDYVVRFRKYIEQKLEVGDVYLVFDRYREYNTKSTTRSGRTTEASRVHKLNRDTPLPQQKVVLTNHGYTQNNKLVVTASNNKLKITTSSDTPWSCDLQRRHIYLP